MCDVLCVVIGEASSVRDDVDGAVTAATETGEDTEQDSQAGGCRKDEDEDLHEGSTMLANGSKYLNNERKKRRSAARGVMLMCVCL